MPSVLAGSVLAGIRERRDMLRAAVEPAAAGQPRVILVRGPAGAGKTRLIAELLRAQPGQPAIAAAAAEAEAALGYALVHQLALAVAVRRPRSGLADGAAAVLRELQPETLAAAADPLAVGAGLRVLLAALSQPEPALVVLEDMHWCDPLSAAALLFACRRLAGDRLAVLVSARPGWPEPASAWQRFVDGDHRATVIELETINAELTAQELRVARLVASGLSNRETAAHLFLSQKTVEFHLGNAYAKLGIRTRHQLARLIGLSSPRANTGRPGRSRCHYEGDILGSPQAAALALLPEDKR